MTGAENHAFFHINKRLRSLFDAQLRNGQFSFWRNLPQIQSSAGHIAPVFIAVDPVKIGAFARAHGLLLIVDAAQSAGILPLSLRSVSGTDVPASLTVLLSRPASPGREALLYSFILPDLPSGDVTVSCHIDEFTDRVEKDDAVVLTILVEPAGKTSGSLDLTLEAVRAIGVRHSSVLTVILIICGVVFLTAAGLAVWFLIKAGRIRLPKLSEIFKKPVRFDYR